MLFRSLLELAANEVIGLASVYAVAAHIDKLTRPDDDAILRKLAVGIESENDRALMLLREFPPAPGESET